MRLINVKTLELEEFHHGNRPYAILSHTWGSEEVTFQEYLLVTGPEAKRYSHIKQKAGFSKIIGACNRACEDKLEYLWCDTNCIDKSSSAELTEAINSMFAWYRDSAVCYVYLADVRISGLLEEFKRSRWFTRGWTLQELLAPQKVLFYNTSWAIIGDRHNMSHAILEATRIHVGALQNPNTIPDYSIAQRMSWAANRRTTRQEDIAYCLLGIFGIHMPLLYGEGLKAFTRLQEEIIKVSDDHSILAWDFLDSRQPSLPGILATSPSQFAYCGSIVRRKDFIRSPHLITNLGVSLELPMIQTCINNTILVALNCSIELQLSGWRSTVWIWLRSIDKNIYTRSPHPASRTSLTEMYPERIHRVTKKFFAITSASMVESWVSDIFSSACRSGPATTGFHVTISFGRIRPQRNTLEFKEAFMPRLSYEIVSAGNYVVLLTIVWDSHRKQPKHCYYERFMNLNGVTIRVMSANDWEVLFPDRERLGVVGNNDAKRIEYVHSQIRKLSGQPAMTAEKGILPSVQMIEELWQDHHGETKVVVHLTFQEETSAKVAGS
ncbi:heterokaryon incompatibility protein-domain-containing protein [Xylaria venustula]|nr:heterokaryon incompatibility protein-domain-containing protein [Xylaria venustula]